jgi:hypothetical protein
LHIYSLTWRFCSHLVLLSRQLFDPSLPSEQRQQLQAAQVKPLGDILKVEAKAYYLAAAERLLSKQAEVSAAVGSCPPELTAAINFKAGARSHAVTTLPKQYKQYSCVAAWGFSQTSHSDA